jgi:hippurate hydrolase
MAQGIAVSAGLPLDRFPTVTIVDDESSPPLYNDPALAVRVRQTLEKTLGAGNVIISAPIMPSEDVGVFGLEGHAIPVVYYWLGAISQAQFAAAKAENRLPPGPHNSRFQPDPVPTLETGVRSMSAVALDLLRPALTRAPIKKGVGAKRD